MCFKNQNKQQITKSELFILECNIFRKYCTYNKLYALNMTKVCYNIDEQNIADGCFDHNLNYIQ